VDVDTSLLSTLAKDGGPPDRGDWGHDADDVIVNMKSTPAETRLKAKQHLQRPGPGDPVLQQPYASQYAQGGQQRPEYGGGHVYGNKPPQGAQGVHAAGSAFIRVSAGVLFMLVLRGQSVASACAFADGRSWSRNKRAAHDLPGAARERTRGCCGKIPKSGWIKSGRRPQAPNSSLLISRLRKVC